MKKFYLLLLSALAASAALADVTVYYDNSLSQWDVVYCNAWGGPTGSGTTSHPGNLMTKGEDDIWSLTIKGSPTLLYFNACSSKTSLITPNDIPVIDGATYDFNENVTFRFYFDNSVLNWNSVYVHYWGGASTDWPGVPMYAKNAGTLYYYEIPATSDNRPTGILFHSDDPTDQLYKGSNQTFDYEFVPSKTYAMQAITNVAFNGSVTGSWSGDIEMTPNGHSSETTWTYNFEATPDQSEFGIRVTYEDGNKVWYMAPEGTPLLEESTSFKMVPEGTNGGFNTRIADGLWNIHFNAYTRQLIAEVEPRNPFRHWTAGIAYGGNDWNSGSNMAYADENGICTFDPIRNLGAYFRIHLADTQNLRYYTLYGPELDALDTWYANPLSPDTNDGAFHLTSPRLFNDIVIKLDLNNMAVMLTRADGGVDTPFSVSYDNRVTRWYTVNVHLWDDRGCSIDLPLVSESGTEESIWYVAETIGFRPSYLMFYSDWTHITDNFEFSDNAVYGEAPDYRLVEGGVVWFDKPDDWADAYIYYSGPVDRSMALPGVKMSYYAPADIPESVRAMAARANAYDDAQGLYYYEIPAGGIETLRFTDGTTGDDAKLTDEITGDAICDRGVYTAAGYSNETTSIGSIEVSADDAVEYFNLQGVRVSDPAPGLYIVRRGNTVTKRILP